MGHNFKLATNLQADTNYSNLFAFHFAHVPNNILFNITISEKVQGIWKINIQFKY